MSDKIGTGEPRSEMDETLIEYGKKLILESIAVINEYIKMMIPLTTGLIATYFALLEFLGVKDIINLQKATAISSTEPALLMLASLVAFILTLFPMIGTMDLGNYKKINRVRKVLFIYRYGGMGIGMFLFIWGIYAMIQVVRTILENVP